MANDLKIQNGKPADENIRPIMVDGKTTSLEISQSGDGAKVTGDLELTNNLDIKGGISKVKTTKIESDGDITINTKDLGSGGDIYLEPKNSVHIIGSNYGEIDLDPSGSGGAGASMKLVSTLSTGDYCILDTGANGATILTTVDNSGEEADLTLDIDGDIILDPNTGKFIAKNAGTEFSATNSAYAGMLLGCTHVFGSGTSGVYQLVTTAWESLLWDTDKYALVTFVVPPSNRVKISVFLPFCQLSGNVIQLGLATDSSATSLDAKYQNNTWDVDETDTVAINYSWVVEGSDHSWSAGETKTIYIMAYADGAIRLYTGGTHDDKYGGVIVEAIALPATIGDGSEP